MQLEGDVGLIRETIEMRVKVMRVFPPSFGLDGLDSLGSFEDGIRLKRV